MKTLIRMGLLLAAWPALVQAAPTCTQRSQDLLAALEAHDYGQAVRHFGGKASSIITPDRLKQVWEQMLPLAYGPYDPVSKEQMPHAQSPNRIITPVHFRRAWLHMRVTCDASGSITMFHFRPGKTGEHDPVSHAAKAISGAWGHSMPMHLKSSWGPLQAVLTLPKGHGPFPAVVMVAGSGAHDADESVGPNKPFRDIARGLAAQGVASLRYEKRTYAYPVRAEKDGRLTIDDEVTDDALVAIHALQDAVHVDSERVFVLGHSLGAMLAPRIAKRSPAAAGVIMLAAPARSLLDVLAEQQREMGTRMGETPQQVAAREKAIAAERRALAAMPAGEVPTGKFMGGPQSYWKSLQDYDQVAVAKSLQVPMLILQGSADFQVSPSRDFARWETLFMHDPRVTLHAYPGLSHLFMPAGKKHSIQDYLIPAHVDAGVIDDMAAWIKRQPARSGGHRGIQPR